MKLRLLFASVLAHATVLFSDVIVGDAVLTPTADPWSGDYRISLVNSIPPGEGAFFVYFDYAGGNLFDFNLHENSYSIAERLTLHLAFYGTMFTPEYVAGSAPLFDNGSPASWSVSIPTNSSVYIAYWDNRDLSPPVSTPTPNDLYGWIQLTHTPTGLVGTASVTALGGGIIVGTTEQIPEPSSIALCILGALAMFRSCRRVKRMAGQACTVNSDPE